MIQKILLVTLTFTSLMANETYLNEMDSLIIDVKNIETTILDKSLESLSNDSVIEKKLNAYELETNAFLKTLSFELTDESIATDMLKKTDELSQTILSLSYSLLDLADKTSENSNSSYLTTLEILTRTTLRLSDDIGVMADRIGTMADRIGEMADRIIQTQKLISKNNKMINDSMMSIIKKFDFSQANKQSQMNRPNMQMPSQNMQMPAAQNMQMNIQSMPMPRGRF